MKVLTEIKALDQASKLPKLFRHNDFGFIVADNQVKPDWLTELAYPLSSGELVQLFLDENQLIGVGFGKTTKYIMLDIDWSSKYHPTHDIDQFRAILNTLETIGLTRHLVIRSSHSGGIHVYFPLPEELPTFQLAAAVRVTLTDTVFDIKNGDLETFPNTKAYAKTETGEFIHYNRHRIPLQPNSGSYLLEDDGLNPQPIPNTTEAQLAAFFHQWDIAAAGQDLELLKQKLPQLYKKFLARKNRFKYQSHEEKTEKAKKWETALDLCIKIGWTGCRQTYHLLPKFLAKAVVFLKLQGEALYEWMYTSITNAPGFSQYSQHQHEIGKMIRSWIATNNRTGYYSPYRSEPDRNQPYPFGNRKLKAKIVRKPHTANIKRSDEAASRIKVAYENIKDRFTAETTITQMRDQLRAEIQAKYGIGIGTNTLSRHKNIWHPEHNLGDNTSLTDSSEQSPETLTDKDSNECIDTPKIEIEPTQTHTQSQEYYSKIPMIGAGDSAPVSPDLTTDSSDPSQTSSTQPHSLGGELVLEVEQDSTNYTKHYNLRPNEVVTQQPKPGKFEVLGGVLSKIATLAALVTNMVAGLKLEPQPTEDAEIELDAVTPDAESKVTPPSVTTPERAEETPLRPCDDPRILPLYITRYNPNQTGVPWTTASEFHKFVGFLVNTAKQDPSISNPWYWAIHTVCDFKDRGANPHWLAFTGQELPYWLRPKERAVEEQLSPTSPSPVAAPDPQSGSAVAAVGNGQPPPDKLPPEASKPPARVKPPVAQNGHAHGKNCPKCQISTPLDELERWKMCRFCASTILFKRKR
jgi:hypothetical protein